MATKKKEPRITKDGKIDKRSLKDKSEHLPQVQFVKQVDGQPVVAEIMQGVRTLYNNRNVAKITNDQELAQRIEWFFDTCIATNQYPTMEKLALVMGYTTDGLQQIANGRRNGFSSDTKHIILAAKQQIAAFDAELAMMGKVNPVLYFFRAKNFYGMKDKQEVEVHQPDLMENYRSTEDIAKDYERNLPKDIIDADFEEV